MEKRYLVNVPDMPFASPLNDGIIKRYKHPKIEQEAPEHGQSIRYVLEDVDELSYAHFLWHRQQPRSNGNIGNNQ